MNNQLAQRLAILIVASFVLMPVLQCMTENAAGTAPSTPPEDFVKGVLSNVIMSSDIGSNYHLGIAPGRDSLMDWISSGDGQDSAYFGCSVASAGDVNGDGYSDVIVGAYDYDTVNENAGKAYLYLGGPNGLRNGPSWTSSGDDHRDDKFGWSVASAGDVNGDGYSDIIIGAPFYWYDSNMRVGKAYMYLGGPSGIATTDPWTSLGPDTADAEFGYSVASAGDVNNDGYSDVIIGTYGLNQAYVYLGGPSGLADTYIWYYTGDGGSSFGYSVAGAGDVNGDGYSDVIVGTESYLEAYLFFGGPSGPATTISVTFSGGEGSNFGTSVASAGDVNGDGYSDVIVGAQGYNDAYLYLGGPNGPSTTSSLTYSGDGDLFGYSVASAGDINGDGYSDVLVGEPDHTPDAGDTFLGKAYLFLGGPGDLSTDPSWTSIGDNQDGSKYGVSVASAGDVNGDGYSDVIVGANQYSTSDYDYIGKAYLISFGWSSVGDDESDAYYGYSVASAGDVNGDSYSDVIVGAYLDNAVSNDAGVAYLYLGGPGGLSTTASWTASGDDQDSAYFGYSVAGAGDVNGDGYSDVIIGASAYTSGNGKAYLYLGGPSGLATSYLYSFSGNEGNAHFGASVASAGDVNGDGYSDVIVGDLGDSSNTGKAYLYLGGPSGPSTTASWTKSGQNGDDYYGISVASAGDVNGDGYSDVIVGADGFDLQDNAGAGKAYLYLGGADGLPDTASWTSSGDQAGDNFYGCSVASAGDVNGDGYSDVLVDAYGYNSETGKAFLYLGGLSGLATSPSWTSTGDSYDTRYGYPLASAGDVNGDGYSDVIIGDNYDTYSIQPEKKAHLFLGGPTGLAYPASWTSLGDDQDYADFGTSVASAGDVNNDGYSDVIIGAPGYTTTHDEYEGKAYLYRGKPMQSGIFTSPALDSGHTDTLWKTISWSPGDQPAGTRLKLQVATSDNGTWKYVGPDGTPNSYFTSTSGKKIWSGQEGKFLRYRVHFSTDDRATTPKLNGVTVTYRPPSPLSVKVVSPNGGEDWMKGRDYPITWTASGNLGTTPISLYYSDDRGETWNLIADLEANDGVYSWTVPDDQTPDAMIKIVVVDLDGKTAMDMSDMSFAIDPPPPVHFTIAAPVTDTVWGAGDHSIDWSLSSSDSARLASKVDIDLSVDGGATWTSLATGVENTGSYELSIAPDTYNTKNALVRLSSKDADGLSVSIMSGRFTIDSVAPQIAQTAHPATTTGVPLRFEATVTDASGVSEVQLWYRMTGEDYRSAKMHLTGNRLYVVEISAQTTAGTMEYYIEASDGTNARTTDVQQVAVNAVAPPKKNGTPVLSVVWLLVGLVVVFAASVAIIRARLSSVRQRALREKRRVRKKRIKVKRHD